MEKWDYAEMTKEAKKHGGPEKYLSDYGEEKYKEGELLGEKKGEVKGVLEGSIITIIAGGAFWGFYKLREHSKRKKAERIAECREKSNAAAKKYIDEANKSIIENAVTDDDQDEIE